MKRHLIIEGPDGAGKDTMINRLQSTRWGRRFKVHPRASDSKEGPLANLDYWVNVHTAELRANPSAGPWIFNRHPLISELIYHDLREVNPGLKGSFIVPYWVDTMKRMMAKSCVLLVILPPLRVVETILASQKPTEQMPGVLNSIEEIHQRYSKVTWPGDVIFYDRTISNPVNLMIDLRHRMENNG